MDLNEAGEEIKGNGGEQVNDEKAFEVLEGDHFRVDDEEGVLIIHRSAECQHDINREEQVHEPVRYSDERIAVSAERKRESSGGGA
jgi:hypothetical protein